LPSNGVNTAASRRAGAEWFQIFYRESGNTKIGGKFRSEGILVEICRGSSGEDSPEARFRGTKESDRVQLLIDFTTNRVTNLDSIGGANV
jgi:hypothetical protein